MRHGMKRCALTQVLSTQLNLVEYADCAKGQKEVLALNNDDNPPTLSFRVKADWIKFNGELMKPVEDPEKEAKREAKEAKKQEALERKQKKKEEKEAKAQAKKEEKERLKEEKAAKAAGKKGNKGEKEAAVQEKEEEEEDDDDDDDEEEEEEISDDESGTEDLSTQWKGCEKKVRGGREFYCKKDENPSDDCDTTLCTMNEEDQDEDDLLDDKSDDIFAKVVILYSLLSQVISKISWY